MIIQVQKQETTKEADKLINMERKNASPSAFEHEIH